MPVNHAITYSLSNGQLFKAVDGSANPLTAPEATIEHLTFYVIGAEKEQPLSTPIQPRVLIVVTGHAGSGKAQTDFKLQTTVSQRQLDI